MGKQKGNQNRPTACLIDFPYDIRNFFFFFFLNIFLVLSQRDICIHLLIAFYGRIFYGKRNICDDENVYPF